MWSCTDTVRLSQRRRKKKKKKRNVIYFGTQCLLGAADESKKKGGVVRAKTLSQELQTKEPAGGVVAGKKCIKVKYLQHYIFYISAQSRETVVWEFACRKIYLCTAAGWLRFQQWNFTCSFYQLLIQRVFNRSSSSLTNELSFSCDETRKTLLLAACKSPRRR